MRGRDAALKLLRRVLEESPADQTEALLLTENSSLARFTPTAVHQHVAEKNETLILRVVLGKKIATVTTNILDRHSIRISLERAMALVKVQPPAETFQSLPKPKAIPLIATHFESIRRLTPERKIRTIREIMTLAKEKGFRASGAFSHGEVEVAVANSLGVEAYQKYSDLILHLIVQNGERSGYASFVSRDADQLQVEPLAAKAVEKLRGGGPVLVEPGEYEVILEPEAVHELLGFLAYLGFHALAVQEGRSFFCGRFGQKLVDEKVTIYDDGLTPWAFKSPWTSKGSPRGKSSFLRTGLPER